MTRLPYERLLRDVILPAWKEEMDTFCAAGGELNTPEMRAGQVAATTRALEGVGWTYDEWTAENHRRRIEAREEMEARIARLEAAEKA